MSHFKKFRETNAGSISLDVSSLSLSFLDFTNADVVTIKDETFK